MPQTRNPQNLAVEMAARLGADFVAWMRHNFPERLGEGPVPQRTMRLGEIDAEALAQQIAAEQQQGGML